MSVGSRMTRYSMVTALLGGGYSRPSRHSIVTESGRFHNRPPSPLRSPLGLEVQRPANLVCYDHRRWRAGRHVGVGFEPNSRPIEMRVSESVLLLSGAADFWWRPSALAMAAIGRRKRNQTEWSDRSDQPDQTRRPDRAVSLAAHSADDTLRARDVAYPRRPGHET